MIQGLLLACACVCNQDASKEAPELAAPAPPAIRVQAVERETVPPQVVVTPAEDPQENDRTEAPPPDRAERLLQLEELLNSLSPQPRPATFTAEEATPLKAIEGKTEDFTILNLRPHTKVTSDYVRVMDVVEFVEDPDEFEPFVSTIIVGPAPELESFGVITREKIEKRLKQHGVPIERVVLTGAREILVLRTKALHDDVASRDPEDLPVPDHETKAVTKGSPVLVIREGSFFRAEEWATAREDGDVGTTIEVADRKDRVLRVRITGPGVAVPAGDHHD